MLKIARPDRRADRSINPTYKTVLNEGNMKRLKKVMAVVLLALVVGMSGGLALAGPSESPGRKGTAESPGITVTGTAESPGFYDATIVFMATLIM